MSVLLKHSDRIYHSDNNRAFLFVFSFGSQLRDSECHQFLQAQFPQQEMFNFECKRFRITSADATILSVNNFPQKIRVLFCFFFTFIITRVPFVKSDIYVISFYFYDFNNLRSRKCPCKQKGGRKCRGKKFYILREKSESHLFLKIPLKL